MSHKLFKLKEKWGTNKNNYLLNISESEELDSKRIILLQNIRDQKFPTIWTRTKTRDQCIKNFFIVESFFEHFILRFHQKVLNRDKIRKKTLMMKIL